MNDEIKNWANLILDELPNIVRPLLFVSIYLILFLFIADKLNLNNSFWFITKEKIFNSAFYLGLFTLLFGALNTAPIQYKKQIFRINYPIDKLNKTYFLIKYEGYDAIYLFEMKKGGRKLWIKNLTTKRYLWGDTVARKPSEVNEIDFQKYPQNQEKDGIIDITASDGKDNMILAFLSVIILGILLRFIRSISF